jgi:hypothetical protein
MWWICCINNSHGSKCGRGLVCIWSQNPELWPVNQITFQYGPGSWARLSLHTKNEHCNYNYIRSLLQELSIKYRSGGDQLVWDQPFMTAMCHICICQKETDTRFRTSLNFNQKTDALSYMYVT